MSITDTRAPGEAAITDAILDAFFEGETKPWVFKVTDAQPEEKNRWRRRIARALAASPPPGPGAAACGPGSDHPVQSLFRALAGLDWSSAPRFSGSVAQWHADLFRAHAAAMGNEAPRYRAMAAAIEAADAVLTGVAAPAPAAGRDDREGDRQGADSGTDLLTATTTVRPDGSTGCNLRFGDRIGFVSGREAVERAIDALRQELAASERCPASKGTSSHPGAAPEGVDLDGLSEDALVKLIASTWLTAKGASGESADDLSDPAELSLISPEDYEACRCIAQVIRARIARLVPSAPHAAGAGGVGREAFARVIFARDLDYLSPAEIMEAFDGPSYSGHRRKAFETADRLLALLQTGMTRTTGAGGDLRTLAEALHEIDPHEEAENYEFRPEGGHYETTDHEKSMLEDFAAGLLNVSDKVTRALDDGVGLCSDPRQRANIALRTLCAVFGMACFELDRAEGRAVEARVSPESFDLMMAVLAGSDPRGSDGTA